MVAAQIKHFQGTQLGDLIWDSAPYEIAAEIQSLQFSALGEVERDGLAEEIVCKVEVRETGKFAGGWRDVSREVEALEIEREN